APTLDSYDCRPYKGSSDEECAVTLAAGETAFWMVNGYAASSTINVGVATPTSGGAYTYNTAAQRFFHVEMDFQFVVEASPERTSHIGQVNSYTQTKHYSYILEADQDGKILGGEWLDNSRQDHPDFVWWPTGKPTSSQASGNVIYREI